MGRYLNPGMESFEKSVNSEIYVDKTGLVGYTNRVMNTVQGYVCVSRPRRLEIHGCEYAYGILQQRL